ncbi:MAG: hypothetical protein QXE86_05495, partial [Archaeoglobaceae archaeon]
MKRYGLIGIVLLALLAMAATPAMAQTPFKGPVNSSDLRITSMELSEDEVSYGDIIKLSVVWGKQEGVDRYIGIYDWTTYTTKVNVSGTFSVANASSSSNYKWFKALPEDSGSETWSISTSEYQMTPEYYVVVAFNSTGTYIDSLVFRVVGVVVGKPTVSISVDRTVVAIGDSVRVKASMSSDVPVATGKIFITGPQPLWTAQCVFQGNRTVKQACYDKDEWWVPIPSTAPEGLYVAKIDVGVGENRSEATATFQVVKPKITSLTVPLQHVKGRDLVIEGTTNLAKSGTRADNETAYNAGIAENKAYLTIKNLAGEIIFNETTPDATNGSAARSFIDDAGKFRFKIDNFGVNKAPVNRELDTGYYIVEVRITSGAMEDNETATFELVKATVKLSADKTTVTRGDDITFTIATNLKVGNNVTFEISNTNFCINQTNYDSCEASKVYKTDVAGKVTIKLKVATDAPLTEYKFKATEELSGVSDEIKVVVVKQALSITPEKTTVARGGEIRFTGTSTANVVFVYANENNIFTIGNQPVIELPTKTKLSGADLNTAKVYPTEKKLDFKVEVLQNADTGTYYLYFFAPANASEIDRSSDVQTMIAIVVTDPRIISVDIPTKIPYQGRIEVAVLTDPGKKENVELTFVFEGSNVKARPQNFNLTDEWSSPNAENYVNWTIDFKDYTGANPLEPGLYLFTVKMRFVGGEEIDSARTSKMVEIVAQT